MVVGYLGGVVGDRDDLELQIHVELFFDGLNGQPVLLEGQGSIVGIEKRDLDGFRRFRRRKGRHGQEHGCCQQQGKQFLHVSPPYLTWGITLSQRAYAPSFLLNKGIPNEAMIPYRIERAFQLIFQHIQSFPEYTCFSASCQAMQKYFHNNANWYKINRSACFTWHVFKKTARNFRIKQQVV